MVDQKYLDSINAHNAKFPDRKLDAEYSLNHRGNTMKEFIKDFQQMLGTNKDGVLGKDDAAAYDKITPFKVGEKSSLLPIVRWAMWCKGYHGGDVNNETYGDGNFLKGLNNLLNDAGIHEVPEFQNNEINFKLLKAIFSMDAYVLIKSRGNEEIRKMQQNMNKYTYKYLGISPCDGIPQTKLIKQIIWYMQITSNDSTDMDGGFGDKTLMNYLNNFHENQNSKKFVESVKILQCLLSMNNCSTIISGQLDDKTYKQIRTFKTMANLDDPFNIQKTNDITKELIAGLLRSCGLKSRKAICCDTSYIINKNYINELKSAGYSIIGRYISGTVGKRNKALTLEEINLLRNNNFDIFLIFQEGGNGLAYFQDASAGERDGHKINKAMEGLNIKENNIVFVAIDCDMYESDFRQYIIPYMQKINDIVTKYRIGVYCSRLGCKILKEKNLSSGFFISGSSFGFSGNSGVPLPDLWNFEQFSTDIKLKTLEIDKVAISLNYKDCVVNFDYKDKRDYTNIIMEKLNEMENTINERYSKDIREEFNTLLLQLLTDNFALFPAIKTKNIIKELIWFYQQVTHKGPWDLKVDESWEKTIGIKPIPRFGLAGANEYFYFSGKYVNREELGNITYGYLGKAMNYPDTILYIGGGVAAQGKNFGEMILNALISGDFLNPPYYGDSKEDHEFIEFGINLYKNKH